MNGVDRNDQLRKNLTVHRGYEHRIWVPQLYFMLDICSVNSYLIWKGSKGDTSVRSHRRYRSALAQACLQTPYPNPVIVSTNTRRRSNCLPCVNTKALSHVWERWEKRGHCVWCKTHVKNWVPKRAPVLQEIVNNAAPGTRKRQFQSWGGCHGCRVYLRQKGACIELFHSQKHQN
jgi:hypothetical protein